MRCEKPCRFHVSLSPSSGHKRESRGKGIRCGWFLRKTAAEVTACPHSPQKHSSLCDCLKQHGTPLQRQSLVQVFHQEELYSTGPECTMPRAQRKPRLEFNTTWTPYHIMPGAFATHKAPDKPAPEPGVFSHWCLWLLPSVGDSSLLRLAGLAPTTAAGHEPVQPTSPQPAVLGPLLRVQVRERT